MNTKSVTMQAIADHLGITKVSVSKALNNQPGVSEELKQRILEVSAQMGYSKRGSQKQAKEDVKLAFLISKRFFLESDNFYTQIYYYLSKECAQKNVNLSLYIVNSKDEDNLVLPFSYGALDGVFIAGEFKNSFIEAIVNLNIPVVAIDFYNHHIQADCIITDNFYASYLATLHLIDKGHKNIGFVGDPNYTSSVLDRFYGYLKAIRGNGLEFREEWNIVNNDSSGAYIMDYALPDKLPSAFICHCDMAAWHLMQRFKTLGISVPDQVSLVSFDNTELSRNCTPPLTTIDISKREFAQKSFQQMLWRLNNMTGEPQRIYIHTKLIERNSVVTLQHRAAKHA
ncbi:LacI family DNA-binding transcriptional regulator [Paenibacillus thermotolerans]|uniref:LacI family DNA-binding transcriptional regulator n=1 Tax=Paenibacillus thermotolerans TaxID=3027807 RepID=UPI002367DD79|nr:MULTISPECIES: LacI family DNA-binding transcriptional regulator [unclassified Paenibacillus]